MIALMFAVAPILLRAIDPAEASQQHCANGECHIAHSSSMVQTRVQSLKRLGTSGTTEQLQEWILVGQEEPFTSCDGNVDHFAGSDGGGTDTIRFLDFPNACTQNDVAG